MSRPRASRRFLGIALGLFLATGIGLGAYSIGTAFGAPTPQVPQTQTTTTAAPVVPGSQGGPGNTAPSSSPLTLEEAKAVAVQVAPGRVVEWDEDNEPTGLRYDVKLLHDDGSTTEVEVDTITGQVTSIKHDNAWD